ncbi:MAG: hypothetical protein JWP89_5407 [Schlesneria sp.]|nr:hypothetical protein [Schlesneria sp.]
MDGRIQYLNTDLDLTSVVDLTSVAAAFELCGLFALDVSQRDDGLWYAIFEADETYDEPGSNISMMLDAVESLGAEQRAVWSGCSVRDFNIGYDCGDEPWAFNQGLSAEILGRIAAVGASLRWTIYPNRHDVAGIASPEEPEAD